MKTHDTVTLYLEPWQVRLLEDHLPVFKTKASIPKKLRQPLMKYKFRPGDCLASYKVILDNRIREVCVVYLTDLQRFQLANELDLPVESVVTFDITVDALENGQIAFG